MSLKTDYFQLWFLYNSELRTSILLVLRICLILIRIRILDPHWKKMNPDPNSDPDPGHFIKIYWFFLTKNNFQIFCFIFSLI